LKQIFGVFTALATAGLIVLMAQMIREGIFPPPPGLNFSDPKAVAAWMVELPASAFVIIAISHAIAAFSAGLISSLVSTKRRILTGFIAVLLLFGIVIFYLFNHQFPAWFVITDTIVTAVLGAIGVFTGSARYVN